jgi:hypothetical protein
VELNKTEKLIRDEWAKRHWFIRPITNYPVTLEVPRGNGIFTQSEYKIDFYFPGFKRGVEFLGLHWHSSKAAVEKDSRRTVELLLQKGIVLLPLTDKDVETQNIDYTMKQIWRFLWKRL